MLYSEFTALTGFYPTYSLYRAIEARYNNDWHGDKQEFCAMYKANTDGIAETIAREEIIREENSIRESQALERELRTEIERLKDELEHEQEWKPYTPVHEVSQSEYDTLCDCSEAMSDDQARDWLHGEFGFDPSAVTICHRASTYEINRHNMLRQCGTTPRIPRFCSTDYYYIRFSVRGYSYEAFSGTLYTI